MKGPTPEGVPKVSASVRDAAWSLGVSEPVVRRLVREGQLPTIPHLGKSIRIPVTALEDFANRGTG